MSKQQSNIKNTEIKNQHSKITFEDLTPYQLGIIWSIGSFIKDESHYRLVLRHQIKHHLSQIQKITNSQIYSQTHKGETQYVLKSQLFDIESFRKNNWFERNADQRDIPVLNSMKDYADFLRAYIEIHSTLDYSLRHNRKSKYKALRLRIYGNFVLLESINKILSIYAGTMIKTLQSTTNEKTKVLYYQKFEEIESIYDFISGKPCHKEYWEDVEKKLAVPRISY